MTNALATLQATASSADGALATHMVEAVFGVLMAGILGMQVWIIRTASAFRDEARTFRQWIFGENGDEGANAMLKAHGATLQERALAFERFDHRILAATESAAIARDAAHRARNAAQEGLVHAERAEEKAVEADGKAELALDRSHYLNDSFQVIAAATGVDFKDRREFPRRRSDR